MNLPTTPPAFPPCVAPLGIYAIAPDYRWVERCFMAGVPSIQLRTKTLTGAALRHEIRACNALTAHSSTQFFVNDYWQYALEYASYGVHLGQEDLRSANITALRTAGVRLGISTHNAFELYTALTYGPSYVACGPIYATTTKKMTIPPRGLVLLSHYVQRAGATPTVAIGGITLARTPEVLATGVSSIAMVSEIVATKDYLAVIKALKTFF